MALSLWMKPIVVFNAKFHRYVGHKSINTNIPLVIKLLKENKLDEAGKMLLKNNPLTTVCSVVCNKN